MPHGYQTDEGALTVHAGGDFVDPYFATKALIAAEEAGLNVDGPARRWIAWLLPRQRPDGRFERYCRADGAWRSCADADADDALSALWMELLNRMTPQGETAPAWAESAQRADAHLNLLRNSKNGLYQVSLGEPFALFIDNVEIYGAFTRMAARRANAGEFIAAGRLGLRAWLLRQAIVRVFWKADEKRFSAATTPPPAAAFYPDVVAQVYPLLENMETPAGGPAQTFNHWFNAHGEAWLGFSEDHYPWGLVALAAYRVGAQSVARQWLARAAPLRNGPRWNLLEEAAYQGLVARFCTRGGADCREGAP